MTQAVHGFLKRVDNLGRMVLPGDLREQLGIQEGDLLDVQVERGRLVLTKAEPARASLRSGRGS
jgi:transcriptional pleiotropic regulator of transition state genes